MTKQQKPKAVVIKPLDKTMLRVSLEEVSPLIMNQMSKNEKQSIVDKQLGYASQPKKEIRDPEKEIEDKLHRFDDGGFGFPTSGVYKCFVAACGRYVQGLPMTEARGIFEVIGEYSQREKQELVRITGTLEKRQDFVPGNGKGRGAAVVFRPQISNWKASFVVKYNSNFLSAEQVINIFNIAGDAVGLGSWSPGSPAGGSFGRFRVVVDEVTKK